MKSLHQKIVAEEIVKYISKEMKKSLIKPEFKKELKSLLNWVFYYLWFIPNSTALKWYTFMRKNINQKNSKKQYELFRPHLNHYFHNYKEVEL